MSGANAQNLLALEDLASGICAPLWLRFKLFFFEDLHLANLCLHSLYVMTAVEEISLNRTAVILQGGSNMTGTDLCVNKPHCAAAVRP
jgi:hypothetical protein